MLATMMNWLLVLAAEGHGIPGNDWRARIAVPLGFLIFVGSVYMLVRSSLGTRRGYLVAATSFFGFMIIYSLFWTFGAPGTPPATGPQNLPGQQLDAYEDVWRPYAGDSRVAEDPIYAVAKTYPNGFSDTPEAAGLPAEITAEADTGAEDIKTFFSTKAGPLQKPPIKKATWAEVESERKFAKATNERPIIAVTFQQTWQIGTLPPGVAPPPGDPLLTVDGERVAEDQSNVAPSGTKINDPVENGETFRAFAYFDKGSPAFPSFLMFLIILVLFILHALGLARDEQRERREREAAAASVPAEERVPAEAGRS